MRVVRGAALPGWILLLWPLPSSVSTGLGAISVIQSVYRWLDKHPVTCSLLGLAFLLLVAAWPSLKAKSFEDGSNS